MFVIKAVTREKKDEFWTPLHVLLSRGEKEREEDSGKKRKDGGKTK